MRRLAYALACVFVLASVAPAAAGAEAVRAWVRPVSGPLARPFDPPKSRFGAGHLGVDFDAAPGTPVRAAGPGLVSFAGAVAGSLHVVIAHAGNLRTSYSFLATLRVRRGASVSAGDVLGTTGGGGEGHDGTVLHMGLRTGDTYVDPMTLFRPLDLSTVVHLAPTSDPPRPVSTSSERRSLLAGLVRGARVVLDAAGHVLRVAGRAATQELAARFPLPVAAVEGTREWFAQRRRCDSHAPPADGTGGSGHLVMLVAGIDSSLTGNESSLAISASALGYLPSEVHYFSYARGGGDYTPADTEGPLLVAARRLGGQLRGLQLRNPGREVDLVAHSQGGVVVEAFFTQVYKRDDRSYPPLGTVVTLSSPLQGDPLASAARDIANVDIGAAALHAVAGVSRRLGMRLPADSNALRDLAADSDLMKQVSDTDWPEGVQLTAIGAPTDLVVPGNAATRPEARGFTAIPIALNAHTGILDDPSAMQAARAALEHKPLPCQSVASVVGGKIASVAIGTLERRAGRVGAVVGLLEGSGP